MRTCEATTKVGERWALAPRSITTLSSIVGALSVATLSCSDAEEPARVGLDLVVDRSALEVTHTDLGYEVGLDEARIMVRDFTFAMAGEAHTTSLLRRAYDWMVPPSYAHPGHFQGGDITGELHGRFLLDWLPGRNTELGSATLLVGKYTNANFTFERAGKDDVDAEDDLLGHTAILRGSATQADRTVDFTALIDSPADRALTGVPFEFHVEENSRPTLHLKLELRDPLEGDTLFDGIDFIALDADGDGEVSILPDSDDAAIDGAYNLLRRALQTHDNYEVRAIAPDQRND